MKFISWNVNGIRACLKKGFIDYIKEESPDIIGLQETKAHQSQVQLHIEGYHQYWHSAEKKGYSGTAIFTKIKPLQVTYGIGIEEHDNEGRVITCEFENYYFITVYVPNSKRGLLRLEYRQKWDADFLVYLKSLEEKKPVIVCGDMNVAHKEIDLKNPKSNYNKTAGFTQQEIDGMDNYLNSGFIDTFRHFYPEKIQYSWWSYMFNARMKGIGWRIDYFLVSDSLKENLKDAFIRDQTMGSDHCPVGLEIDI